MDENDLAYLTATRALALFRARELSPVELLEAQIRRAEAVEPAVNAFADTYFEEALERARKAEARYAKGGARPRSLEGLPLAVKDDTAIEGRRTTAGSLVHRDRIDAFTNPSVERLLRAGAILHARTTCPEMCWPWVCYSRLHGVTRNPWNPKYTCGASSGGSAAALAAGTTTIATGTDSAGSIRMPAAMCGIVGYKPPYGRNPESPALNLDFYNHIGPMARSVADCALMQNAMAGPHPRDHATVKPKLRIPSELKGIEGLRIAYSIDLGRHEVADDVRHNTLETLEVLRGAGARVEEVAAGWAREPLQVVYDHGDHLYADDFAKMAHDHADQVTDYTPFFARQCAEVTQARFHDTLRISAQAWLEFGALLETYQAFVCPTVATTEVPADLRPWQEVTINGRPVAGSGEFVMTPLFNMFSRCPVLAVPSGISGGGVPTGIQIAGRTFDDVTVFRIAAALERERPWFDGPLRRPSHTRG